MKKKPSLTKVIIAVLALSVLFVCIQQIFFARDIANPVLRSPSGERYFIIDTDAGADDAMAITMALKSPNINILGITVAAGNVELEQGMDNVLMTVETCGKDVPVYAGSAVTYSGVKRDTYSVYGEDGMGDSGLINPTLQPADGNGIDFILEMARKYPGELEIVSLGTATDLAFAIEKDPSAMKNVKRIWSMATSGFGSGNATPVAEFNVYKDAEAYKVLLDSNLPLSIIGLDMVEEPTWLGKKEINTLMSDSPEGRFLGQAVRKLMEYKIQQIGVEVFDPCDPVAMAVALWPDFTKDSVLCSASCITDEDETHGQVIFYRSDTVYDSMIELDDPNVTLITDIKGVLFFPRLRYLLKAT